MEEKILKIVELIDRSGGSEGFTFEYTKPNCWPYTFAGVNGEIWSDVFNTPEEALAELLTLMEP